MSRHLGTDVKAWDDWYAIYPHGKEWTAHPDGTYKETGDTCRKYNGSYIEWCNGHFQGPKPGWPDGKPTWDNGNDVDIDF